MTSSARNRGKAVLMMVLHLIWALTLAPETKGRPLEDIHLWRRPESE